MCAGIANVIIKYGPIIKKKKKKATRPTLFENFMLLQYNNFFFFWPYQKLRHLGGSKSFNSRRFYPYVPSSTSTKFFILK